MTITSVFAFFALVFALSIPFWVLGAVYPIELLPGLPVSALGAFTPALAAAILVYQRGRLPAVRQLLGRSFDFKRIRNKAWYLVIILVNPAVAVLAYGIMRALGRSLPNPSGLTPAVLLLFVSFFVAALGEEIGWTGYATGTLQRHWGTLAAGLGLGLVWAAWHFVPLVQAHRSLQWIAWWSLGTISSRVIMVWLYVHAGESVFAAALFHAMINLCWQLFPVNGSFYDPQISGLITLGLAMAILAVQQVVTRGKVV
jgi:membrane protease YdiL (CAAX protease family)